MEKVLRIIEEKMKSNDRLSKEDILIILEVYCEFYKLESFIKKVYFIDESNLKYSAFYNQDNLSLVFIMNKVYENVVANYKFVSKETKINFNSFYNFFLLITMFHELKHIIQYKKIFLGLDDNFLKIYNENEILRKKYGKNSKLYINHHDLFPCEREANIFSVRETLKYFGALKRGIINKEELRFYQLYYINLLLSNYDRNLFNIKSPFEKLVKLGNGDSLRQVDAVNKVYLSLYNRILLGLPISKKEYGRILDLYYSLEEDELSPYVDIEKIIVKRG